MHQVKGKPFFFFFKFWWVCLSPEMEHQELVLNCSMFCCVLYVACWSFSLKISSQNLEFGRLFYEFWFSAMFVLEIEYFCWRIFIRINAFSVICMLRMMAKHVYGNLSRIFLVWECWNPNELYFWLFHHTHRCLSSLIWTMKGSQIPGFL